VEVPNGDALGFVILQKDSAKVMYQTWSSIDTDIGHPVAQFPQLAV
jgi:hypothetical protein